MADATPADIFGPLFRSIQLARIFPDSKCFPDAIQIHDSSYIMNQYYRLSDSENFNLHKFAIENFSFPFATPFSLSTASRSPLSMRDHIESLWQSLSRVPLSASSCGSEIVLPEPYVIPGGRFREIYYWDSYFTMVGLACDGRHDLVESMIDNFTYLIERYGHIPNGTRTYYLSRSQPPVFYLMLGLSRNREEKVLRQRLAALRSEHRYWMLGETDLGPGEARNHVVRLADGTLLNRYSDACDVPREEGFAEDVATAAGARTSTSLVYRNLRAAAESGWDFSSRWLEAPDVLSSIRTTSIAPVDLNSLLYGMERSISVLCTLLSERVLAGEFQRRADLRGAGICRHFWDGARGHFSDIDWTAGRRTGILSAATLFPLFVTVANPHQIRSVAVTVERELLAPGGVRTTTIETGQQWDKPNGWAPLQWIAVNGLWRNRRHALAREISARWLTMVSTYYEKTGKLVEKYDIEAGIGGCGGEYPLQDGFGWTNGVTRALLAKFG